MGACVLRRRWGRMMLFVLLAAVAVLVEGKDCGQGDTLLQLVHSQDVSYSADSLLTDVVDVVPTVVASLKAAYGRVQVGVTSFSDKPIRPHGSPKGDYCYREEAVIAEDTDLQSELNKLEILSGLDWQEAQLDAVAYSMSSDTMGWIRQESDEEEKLQRIVVLMTDSLPHTAGLLPELPGGSRCEDNDYLSLDQLQLMLDLWDTKLIVVASDDLAELWLRRIGGWPNAAMLRHSEYASGLQSLIEDFLCDDTTTTTVDPMNGMPPMTPPNRN